MEVEPVKYVSGLGLHLVSRIEVSDPIIFSHDKGSDSRGNPPAIDRRPKFEDFKSF